jgi:hypothetical protein
VLPVRGSREIDMVVTGTERAVALTGRALSKSTRLTVLDPFRSFNRGGETGSRDRRSQRVARCYLDVEPGAMPAACPS